MPYTLRWPFHVTHTTRLLALCVSFLVLLSACSGAGVIATSDPDKKLAQAAQLERSGRVGRARQLTSDAADLFAAQGNKQGLAKAYRQMAFLIRSYGQDAILVSSGSTLTTLDVATADKSTEYFERAQVIHQELEDYDLVSHLQFNIGVNFALSDRSPRACSAFDQSLAAYKAEKKRRPEHDPALPSGITSFDDFITKAKLEARCG